MRTTTFSNKRNTTNRLPTIKYEIVHDENIVQSEKAEGQIALLDRLNLIGQMAASIGHEVRNPLTTVRGFLQLLAAKEELTKYGEEFLLMISELDRANDIITNFLSLAKDKAIEKKKQDINGIIKVLLPLIQAEALISDKNISLELGKVPELVVDEGEIKQMLLNLVRNSLEAIPPGGKMGIKTYKQTRDVVLAVRNNGPRIPKEMMDKISTPFVTTKENGTGLGLPICYRIAERHNARIEFETSDKGTTFYVTFRSEST